MLIFVVSYFFRVLYFLLVVRALLSWVIRDFRHPVVRFVIQATDPILKPMRDVFERFGLMGMGIDFSFLATFVLLQMLEGLVIRLLINVGL